MLIILPSRNRAQKIEEAITCWRETRDFADLLVCLDDDDPQLNDYKRHKDVIYDVGERIRLCPTVNRAIKDHPGYDYYGFIGDDHRFRTQGWDTQFRDVIEEHGGWGVAYGDDMLQGQKLATAAVLSANIVNTLGYMALPGTTHLFMDNFHMEIGQGIDRLFFIPHVVIEHMHYSVGKSESDDLYVEVNSDEMLSHDGMVFREWSQTKKAEDIAKLREVMNAS
jgi:hypothetical protein